MFKIKNYTGNGIKVNGNVKIDENGIATLFTTPTDYIKTNLKALDVMNSTEFQIKFRTRNKTNRLISCITSHTSVIKLNCLSSSQWDTSLSLTNSDKVGNTTYYIFKKTNFDISKYYNQWLCIKITNDNENRTLTLSTETDLILTLTSKVKQYVPQNQDIILGQTYGNYDYTSDKLEIDLSETYFKKDSTIISSWNL